MKNRKWVVAVLVLASGTLAHAANTANTQLCWASYGSEDNAFASCTFTSQTEGGTSSVESRVTPNPDASMPDQVFSGTASASATADTWRVAMTLGVDNYRRDMYVWTESTSRGTFAATTASAGARTTDTVTVTGGTGVYALNYIFSLDGTLASSDPSLLSAQFCASLSMPTGLGTVTSFCRSAGQSLPSTFTLSYADLPFDGPIVPTLSVSVFGFVEPIYAADLPFVGADTVTVNGSAQFGSTVHLTSMLVTDATGAPVEGVQISSQNGYVYPLDPLNAAPVPEPSSWLLLACGLGLFWRRGTAGSRAGNNVRQMGR